MEQCIEWNNKLHLNFIDFEKAFDSVHRESLWKILLAYGCPEKFVKILKAFYNNFTCSVIDDNKISDWFNITSGVRQGCIMSPMLFLVAIDWVMRKTVGNKQRGIRWTITSLLEDLDFADDIALLSNNAEHLQRKTEDLSKYANQVGLKINKKKTKTMQLVPSPTVITLDNEPLDEVDDFTYLGSVISKNNATSKDITSRLQKANIAFHQLNKIWKNNNISLKTKIKIYTSNVLSVLLYGSECWRVTQKDSQRLSGFHTKSLRKVCKIYWPTKITNEALYQKTGQHNIMAQIKQRRLRWFGHVARKDQSNITRTASKWTPSNGKRSRGRPKETWRRTITSDFNSMGKTWGEMEKLAKDRGTWRSLVMDAALCASRREEDK